MIAKDTLWVTIPLARVAGHPSQHHVSSREQFGNFYVTGYLFPSLHWRDNGLFVYNEATKSARAVPHMRRISKWTAIQLESIFSGDFYVHLVGVCQAVQTIYVGCARTCSICATAENWPLAEGTRRQDTSTPRATDVRENERGDHQMAPLLSRDLNNYNKADMSSQDTRL